MEHKVKTAVATVNPDLDLSIALQDVIFLLNALVEIDKPEKIVKGILGRLNIAEMSLTNNPLFPLFFSME